MSIVIGWSHCDKCISLIKLGLSYDTNFTIRFWLYSDIDYFGYIIGTVHAKLSQGVF